ncbi:MAG: peptide synthase [Planctomycetes bacterium]|nr:peptide synthase [Planctomycetota bacterium]
MSAANVSLELRRRAAEAPGRLAVHAFGLWERKLTFEQLERRVDACAHALAELGLARGERAALFVPPGPDFVALFHALLRLGALPVLIDPGMGRAALLACLERAAPSTLIGVAKVHLARKLFPRSFASVRLAVAIGPAPALGAHALERRAAAAPRTPFPLVTPLDGAPAAVLFTSGSTGPAKGVVYTHANFGAQLAALRTHFGLEPGGVDGACFPLFALFDNALGLTSVFPALDPSRPASCKPAAVLRALEQSAATFSFASPAVWARVVPWMSARRKRFTQLRRVTLAGAPVAPALVHALRALLPAGGEVHTPYGATEALPVSDIAGAELAALRPSIERGAGSCVGRPLAGVELALVRVSDEPLARWDESLCVPHGEAGEVCVKGAVVTRAYLDDPAADARAKIADGAEVWHRMGDVGRFDADGRLWFLGRKSQRLETAHGVLYPVPLENAFAVTRGVVRTALVGVGPRGSERPVMVVESRESERTLMPRLRQRSGELANTPGAARIERFLFHPRFPVDVRHNAKIRREELKKWAEDELS